jgi:hypothetical protein
MSKIEYIPNEYNNIKSDCKIIKEIKNEKKEIEKGDFTSFYVWEITVELNDQIDSKFFDTLKEIRFTFDPTFDEHKQIFPITKQMKKFSLKAIGWDSTKLEIAFERTDGSVLKQVIQLQTKNV